MWKIKLTKNAIKDIPKLKSAGLWDKTKRILDILKNNPFQNPPSYEKLVGDLKGFYSRRINQQHRIVYKVFSDIVIVEIFAMWTHYE